MNSQIWGVSSAGRAPALQAGGHRFDPGTLHHTRDWLKQQVTEMLIEVSLSFLKEGFNDAPWKLNIETLLMQYYEKATVKENF